MRWEIGALTLGDGHPEPFGLLKFYCTPFLTRGGGVTLGDCLRLCEFLGVTCFGLGNSLSLDTRVVACVSGSCGGWASYG